METKILFLKGGKAGAPGLYERLIVGKDGVKRTHWIRGAKPQKIAHNDAQLFLLDNLYAPLETRPGTKPEQKREGLNALASLQRRINLLRDRGGSAATLLGARLHAGFVASGGNQLVGQHISSTGDLAALAQVYRDPRFETFRVIYLKGDEVVGEAAYSSRLPGAVQLPDNFLTLIEADKARFGSNGYYLLHNHPAGFSRPSIADENLTGEINSAVSGMRGHVIVDHHEYSVIAKNGDTSVHQEPALSGPDYHASPSMGHPLLGVKIRTPKDAAIAAKALQAGNKSGAPVLVMTKGQFAEVDLIASVPDALLQKMMGKTDRAKAWLRGIGRASGSGSSRFLMLSDADFKKHTKEFTDLVDKGLVTDVVSESGVSFRERHYSYQGLIAKDVFDSIKPGRKVAEHEGDAGRLPGAYPDNLATAVTGTNVSTLYKAGLSAGEELVPLNPATDKKPQMVSPAYRAAKRDGNGVAAGVVVTAAIRQKVINEIRSKLIPGIPVVFVPVMHKDQGESGNMIPRAYAKALAKLIPGEVEQGITKTSGYANTGATLDDRANNEQTFVGEVRKGVQYVVVDDTFTSGSTVSALTAHIQSHGGMVSAITALAAGKYQNYLRHRPQDAAKMLAKLGLSEVEFEHETRIPINAITGSEIYRLANLDGDRCSLETVRKRFSKRARIPAGGSQARGFGNRSVLQSESASLGSPQITPPKPLTKAVLFFKKSLPSGPINNGADLRAQSYTKGGAMLAIPENTRILFFKSHISAYTTRGGTFVPAHDDKRTKRVVSKDTHTPDLFSLPAHTPDSHEWRHENKGQFNESATLYDSKNNPRAKINKSGKNWLDSSGKTHDSEGAAKVWHERSMQHNDENDTKRRSTKDFTPVPKAGSKPIVDTPKKNAELAEVTDEFASRIADFDNHKDKGLSTHSLKFMADKAHALIDTSLASGKIDEAQAHKWGLLVDERMGLPSGRLSVALKRGDLGAALKVLEPLSYYEASEALLRVGFSLGFHKTKTTKALIADVQNQLVRASNKKTDGYGLRTMAKSLPILFLKSHVKQFTRQDGTIVKEHDDKRTKKMQAAPVGREPAKQDEPAASKYGHHNVEEGDSIQFKAGEFSGSGKVKSSGKDGAVVSDSSGRDHNVHWNEVSGRGEAKKEEGSGTMTSGKNLGWKSLPTKVVSRDEGQKMIDAEHAKDAAKANGGKKKFFDPSEVESLPHKDTVKQSVFKDWAGAAKIGPAALEEYNGLLGEMSKSCGFETGKGSPDNMTDEQLDNDTSYLFMGPMKQEGKSTRKVNVDYHGDWSQLKDLVRATVAVRGIEDVHKTLAWLKAAGLEFAQKPKDNMTNGTKDGYRDLNLILKLPETGMLVELQIAVKQISKVKGEAHSFYNDNVALDQKRKEANRATAEKNSVGEPKAPYVDNEELEANWSDKGDFKTFMANRASQNKIYGGAWSKVPGIEQILKALSWARGKMILFLKGGKKHGLLH
ncbi:hypothetical protein [Propionivibrio sp.]|uniref:hypothetical protein n=1 Tax=Propionivibrio sp. TaxID=2212460 RepID=UPI003BF38D49